MLMQASGKLVLVHRLLPLLLVLILGQSTIAEVADVPQLSKEFTGITASDLDEIRQELEKVKSQNSRMKEEIDILRAETQQDWMTEQRAEEIKGLVQDVLADADTRASLMGNGLMAGWSDGFFLASADGRFRLNIGALMQVRFLANILNGDDGDVVNNSDRTRYGFENTTTRFNLGGHVFDDTQFFMEMGFGRLDPYGFSDDPQQFGTRLYEGWIKQRLTENIAVKAGIFKLPFTREFLVYEGLQLAVDRSLIDYRFGLGRSQGVQLDMALGSVRTQVAFTNGSTALFSIRNQEQVPPYAAYRPDTEWSATGRLEWLLAGEWEQFRQFTSPTHQEFGLMLGVAGTGQSQERDESTDNPKNMLYGLTADVSADFGGASLFASMVWQRQMDPGGDIDSLDYWGLVAQGSMYVDPKWEIYARYEMGGPFNQVLNDPEGSGIDTQGVSILTVGFNWYLDGQDVKFTTDFGVSFDPITGFMTIDQTGWRTDPDNHHAQFLIRSQLQLMF